MGSAARRRHYRLLLASCVALLAIFTLPDPWGSLATPGYLLLGLSGGILSAAVESVAPGSFSGINLMVQDRDGPAGVWRLDFVRLNDYAFASLTTTGYGNILPVTPAAQMMSIGLAVAGNSNLAIVLEVLIGRFSNRNGGDGDRPRGAAGDQAVAEGC